MTDATPLPSQVICAKCGFASRGSLAPTEAAEVCRCLHFNELRNINFIRRCAAFIARVQGAYYFADRGGTPIEIKESPPAPGIERIAAAAPSPDSKLLMQHYAALLQILHAQQLHAQTCHTMIATGAGLHVPGCIHCKTFAHEADNARARHRETQHRVFG